MPPAKGFDTYRDREWMYQKYVVEKLPMVDLAKLAGCHDSTIHAWLHELDISVRSRGEALREGFLSGRVIVSEERRKAHSERAKQRWVEGTFKNVSSPEAARKRSAGVKAAWLRGDFSGNSEKLRAAHARGCYDAVPDKVRAAFARGAYDGVFQSPTSIEILAREALNELGFTFVEQFRPQNCCYIFDFYLPEYSMLLEVQGEYWHRIRDMRLRDIYKRIWAREHGYCVNEIWGNALREAPVGSVEKAMIDCPGIQYDHFKRLMRNRRCAEN